MTLPATAHWRVGHGRTVELGPKSVLIGILNVTPDSFSDGGRFMALDDAVAQARRMRDEGAAIVDVGGESTRPGAEPVSEAEEQRRVLPVIDALAAEGFLVSVDTYRASTARLAVAAGAHIVNDVWGAQREPDIARVAAETGAGLCLMHTGRGREPLPDAVEDQVAFLDRSLAIARGAGVADEAIVLDPGFGFGKEKAELNLDLVARFAELRRRLGFPMLVGTSRKRFVRSVLGEGANADIATAATSVMLRERGAALFRVHDVAANRDALTVADAVLARGAR
ncbi:dihydropteroate synthase [Aureimonas leprariae]|uniref:Dihydropteroate synthase n=1 Tax=Plantimonas leprariae TaxID=2615207 RepID=A0A7V7TXJ4_9HYPH|nr:dihydropteroate synthase [Aureimonas leprariae]KAB0680848.1 dihydropteroate synthase [Aureimonas leprariae]